MRGRSLALAALTRFRAAWLLGLLFVAGPAGAAVPAMIVPGQFNVTDTGAFTYTIPIVVPPGTGGMAPALSLDYSSQNTGNGIAGYGWAVSGLPSITRCPETVAQDGAKTGVVYGATDRFCLNGQKLIAYQGAYGADGTFYYTEVNGFTNIESVGTTGTGPTHFVAWTKAGQLMEFGNTPDSQGPLIKVSCSYPPTTCPGNNSATVRVWAVNKIADNAGNYLTITYDGGTPDSSGGEIYPTQISYTFNDAAGVTSHNAVDFGYITRKDQIPVYQAGYMTVSSHLLTTIDLWAKGQMAGEYQLNYDQAADAAHVNKLKSVAYCDSSKTNCLAPTTFTWQGGQATAPTSVKATL